MQATLYKDYTSGIKIYTFTDSKYKDKLFFKAVGASKTMQPHGSWGPVNWLGTAKLRKQFLYNSEGLPIKELLWVIRTDVLTEEISKKLDSLDNKTIKTFLPSTFDLLYYISRDVTSNFIDDTIEDKLEKYSLKNILITRSNTLDINIYNKDEIDKQIDESEANRDKLVNNSIKNELTPEIKQGISDNAKDPAESMSNGNDTQTEGTDASQETDKKTKPKTFTELFNEELENSNDNYNIYNGQVNGRAISNLSTNVSNQVATGLGSTNAMQAVGKTIGVAGSAMSAIATAQSLSKLCVEKITSEVTSYLTDKTTELLTFDLTKILSFSAQDVLTYTMNAAAIISELTQSQESLLDGAAEAAIGELTTNIQTGITKDINKLTKGINDKLEKYTTKIDSITTYISKGEDFLITNMDLICNSAIEECEKQIGKAFNPIQERKEEMYKNIANKKAQKKADEVNKKLKTTLKVKLDKVKETKEQAKVLAKTLIKVAILKLKGMLGG